MKRGWRPAGASLTQLLLCAVLLSLFGRSSIAQTSKFYNLDQNATLWQMYIDPPGNTASYVLENVLNPSLDGTALHLGIVSPPEGAPAPTPYTGLHAYRNFAAQPYARFFQLTTRFRYRSSAFPIQAIEFSQSKWQNGLRWEWALQWENIGDGTPQQGSPPCWRIWTGSGWQPVGRTQNLAPDTWHSLTLQGSIAQNGRVQYAQMICDGVVTQLGQTFAPVPASYQQVSVGVQLDGDYAMHPQDVYFDYLNFSCW